MKKSVEKLQVNGVKMNKCRLSEQYDIIHVTRILGTTSHA